MHTETTTTRVQAFIARYRAEVALTLGALLTFALIVGWALVAPLMGIRSDNLTTAISAFAALAGATVALACYWGTE